jgi:hypothetical protein
LDIQLAVYANRGGSVIAAIQIAHGSAAYLGRLPLSIHDGSTTVSPLPLDFLPVLILDFSPFVFFNITSRVSDDHSILGYQRRDSSPRHGSPRSGEKKKSRTPRRISRISVDLAPKFYAPNVTILRRVQAM